MSGIDGRGAMILRRVIAMSASRNGPRSQSIWSSSCSASSSASRSRTGMRRGPIASARTATWSAIRDDLDADIAGYRDRLDFGEVSASGAKGLAYAERAMPAELHNGTSCAPISGRARWGHSTSLKRRTTSSGVQASWDLLGDPRLRDRLAYYYTNSKIPCCRRARIPPACARSHPAGNPALPLGECWQSDPSGQQRAVACSSPVDEARAGGVVDEIRSDTTLMRELRYWMSTMRVAEKTGLNNMGVAIGLRDAVDAKVGRRNPAP